MQQTKSYKILAKWQYIDDDNVQQTWRGCHRCGYPECTISPKFYQDNGTPLCNCGDDMVYVSTNIRLRKTKKIRMANVE